MKRIKAINGYTIYMITERDEKQGNGVAGEYNIYFSSDVREYGVAYSYPEYEGLETLEQAIECISDGESKLYAQAYNELSEEYTAVSYEDVEERMQEIQAEQAQKEVKVMFKELTAQFKADKERTRKENEFYIIHGFMESWAEEHRKESDNGLRRYSTDLRWEQYTNGVINREQATAYAIKRMSKQIDKDIAKGLDRLASVAGAPDISEIFIDVDWVRSSTWGMNPHAYAETRNARTYGTASGCGYDKESASVAQALNQDNSVLKILYTLKEQGLREGKTSESKTACTGHDNRDIIGYGAGYSVLPYFEGGVGVSCFWAILKKAGFEVHGSHGKKFDHYTLTR